jgi:hypothetical protein
MIISFDSPDAVDEVWLRASGGRPSFPRLVAETFRELAKLNPQSTVHAKTLYSAVNVVRRCTPEPVFAELTNRPYFLHVGDFYWRFDESRWSESEAGA